MRIAFLELIAPASARMLFALLTWLTWLTGAFAAGAQVVPGTGNGIGSVAADRLRLDEIRGRMALASRVDSAPGVAAFTFVRPALRSTWNSEVPLSENDGSLWSGRGMSTLVSAGVQYRVQLGGIALAVDVVPAVALSENKPFQFFPDTEVQRSAFSSPWHLREFPADLPLRFGDRRMQSVDFGQSAVTMTAGRVAFGVSSMNEWWSPGIRNSLVLSNTAAGIPRAFVRTASPVRSRFGEFSGRLFVGTLTESPFFDRDPTNDHRSANGVLLRFQPSFDSGLTLGVSRLVIARIGSASGSLEHGLDVISEWGARHFESTGAIGSDQQSDQLSSFFARWVFPASGFEAYGEWARSELPRSVRELFVYPDNAQAFTLGIQWSDIRRRDGFLRLQAEVSDLEQSTVIPGRPQPDYYTGIAAVQGFTQRGQLLGAAIGPGGSSQFGAADFIAPLWQAGAFAGRTRTENDALFRQANTGPTRHDVSLYSGIRGALRTRTTDMSASVTITRRLNYLFQEYTKSIVAPDGIDIQNLTLTFAITPR